MEKKLKNVQKSFGSMSKKVQLLISILRVAENLEEVPIAIHHIVLRLIDGAESWTLGHRAVHHDCVEPSRQRHDGVEVSTPRL